MCKNRFELAPLAASGNAAWTQRAVLNRGKTSGVQEHGWSEHLFLAKIATPPCLPVGVEARAVLSWPPFLKVTGGHASPCMARIPLLCKNVVLLLVPAAAVRRVSCTTRTSACLMRLSWCSIQELTLRLRILRILQEVSLESVGLSS
jgi:hypothetical protein